MAESKLFTVTKGTSPDDAGTFETDDVEETKVDAPFVSVRLNQALSAKAIEEFISGKRDPKH